jgi:serine protease AprX
MNSFFASWRRPALVVAAATLAMCAIIPDQSADATLARVGQPQIVTAEITPSLERLFLDDPSVHRVWVFFTDKGINTQRDYDAAIDELLRTYNPRAIQRRQMRGRNAQRNGRVFDERDFPLVPAYLDAVAGTGVKMRHETTWLNAVSVEADWQQVQALAKLPCVAKLQPVNRSRRIEPINSQPSPQPSVSDRGGLDYGRSTEQLNEMNLIALHDAGYTGQGVIIGILDTGFRRDHEAFNQIGHVVNVLAEYDFVDDDPDASNEAGDPSSQHEHGTLILGCIGSYFPGELVGGAYNASFVLAKTEDTTGEYQGEEDNYVAGLQFIEANGADMSTSSLGYIDWYTQADLDGQTAVTTIAVNIANDNGMHCCTAAGNENHDSNPSTSSIIAPADAFEVLTCGAVSSSGTIASFSSDGPTADGRVKPELCARGSGTDTVSAFSTDSYRTADGTSLSTPLLACTPWPASSRPGRTGRPTDMRDSACSRQPATTWDPTATSGTIRTYVYGATASSMPTRPTTTPRPTCRRGHAHRFHDPVFM